MRSRLPYVGALDGLRAVAVAAVLLYHGGVAALPGGFLGVDVFFVLSGFLITSLLLAEREATGRIGLARFWLRRARRLLPAAFTAIAVTLVAVAVLAPEQALRTRGDALSSFAYVNNWHQVLAERSYFTTFGPPSPLEHLWSLAVEEQFYLLWPLLFGVVAARRRRVPATAAAAVASALAMALLFRPGGDPTRVYFGTDTHASGLLIGAALAFAWPLGRFRALPRPSAVWVLDAAALAACAAVLAALLLLRDFDPATYRGGIAAAGVATAVLVAALSHPACRVARAFAVAPLRWTGARSYGIYLWHWPVMVLIDVWLPLQIALAVLIAAASYRWIEQPVRTGAARAWLDRRRPRRRLGIVLGSVAALFATVAVAGARSGGPPPVPQLDLSRSAAARVAVTPDPSREARRPLAVGASVMLAARKTLGRHATVDAAIGRQTADILARLERYDAAGALPPAVVVQIGENGPIFESDMRRLRRALAGVHRVVLVTVRVPRSWSAAADAALARAVRGWKEARLADWHAASARPGALYPDGTHPTIKGTRIYARIVARALR